MTGVGFNRLYPLPHVDRIYYFENIPHHEVLVTAPIIRSEKFTLWPLTSSLPLGSRTSGATSAKKSLNADKAVSFVFLAMNSPF